jgi:hypothetical protein
LRWHDGMLQWVRHAGQIVNVSRWADTPPGARPSTTCPVCEQPVVLKLGRRRSHHAAHRADDACPATHPETADHINAKFHLAFELRRVGALSLLDQCAEPTPTPPRYPPQVCVQTRVRPWHPGWDEVVVEERLGTLRPDLQLRREGQTVAAIEVLYSHAVSEEKAAALAVLGVPWIEVSTRDVFGRTAALWKAEEPLAVLRETPKAPWVCGAHLEEEAQRQARARIATASGPVHHKLRVADCYGSHGSEGRRRYIYWTSETWDAGEVVQVRLLRDPGAVLILELASEDFDLRDERVEAEFARDLQARVRTKGTFFDSPMPWVDADGPPWDLPARYTWDVGLGKWVLRPEAEGLRWEERKGR